MQTGIKDHKRGKISLCDESKVFTGRTGSTPLASFQYAGMNGVRVTYRDLGTTFSYNGLDQVLRRILPEQTAEAYKRNAY